MALLTLWPTYADDDGTFTFGTVVNKVLLDDMKAAVEAVVHSATNPTLTPKDIINEAVTARGSLGSLDARLDVSLNDDGTLKTQASLVTVVQARTLPQGNLVPNGDFLIWARGDAAAPDYWTLSGAGAVIARTGTGLADTQRAKYGDFAVKLTFGSAAAKLTHTLLSTAAFARADGLKGRKVSFGAWVKSSIANHARIVVDDGATQTASAYHTGSGNLEWVTVVHTISSSATKLAIYLEVSASGSAYFGAVCGIFADLAPADFISCAMQKGVVHFAVVGTLAVATKKGVFAPGAPGIVTDVQLRAETGPVGAAVIVDVNTWDGSAFTSMFTTRPTIVDGASQGGAAPDTTYARRCVRPMFGATLAAGNLMSFDVDQIGIGTKGADLIVEVRMRQYVRVLEAYLDFGDTGE